MFSQAECNLEAFELEPSVWELIQSFCPEREIGEVRRTLGASLVEQARDLHEEVNPICVYVGLLVCSMWVRVN